ncbi:PREDICTED: tumor necrosis factor receptor superfamily member 1B [Tinamus guttatus]|uniref:tumor necrosis factor receptor superfamily member 1B n=1 Tax=Tinamus guttatus TaxID=94827 RepID=UPI00052F2F5E|nr:PREDICTED: tumor necrosis factor receptor superfamily member 1B [Tinamus guttatus]
MEKDYSLPYTPQFAQCKDTIREFYEESLNKCCSRCPPGQYELQNCTDRIDTKCSPCELNSYTAVWNRSPQCFACLPPCRKGFVQLQACTESQDRICSCPPNEYCISKIYDQCEMCRVHKKCGKGYRVSKRGTDSTDTECVPCPPGNFSDEESYSTSCKPHRVCKTVAIPGNRTHDTVCSDSGVVLTTALPHTAVKTILTQSSNSDRPEILTRPVVLSAAPDTSYIIGSVAGPLVLIVIIAVLGYCLVSRKKSTFIFSTNWGSRFGECDSFIPFHLLRFSNSYIEIKPSYLIMKKLKLYIFLQMFQPFSPAEKQCEKKVRNTGPQKSSNSEQEEQHLLETPGSSSSSLNNPAGASRISVISNKNNEKKEVEGLQQQYSVTEGCKLHSGDRHNSASSEHSGNGGTQVNVTCIVKVCNSDRSAQFPEQTSSTSMDYGNAPHYSPTGEEIPLSKEENLLQKETEIKISVETEDDLLQDLLPEEKTFPLGIQDVGMKIS